MFCHHKPTMRMLRHALTFVLSLSSAHSFAHWNHRSITRTFSFPTTLQKAVSDQLERIITDGVHSKGGSSLILPTLTDLCKVNTLQSAERAERLLLLLQEQCGAIYVTSKHFALVVRAWGRVGRPEKADALFHQIVAPSREAFHALISAHVCAGNLVPAELLLQRMEADPHAQPLTTDYNLILAGYARNGQVAESEALLNRMIARFSEECEPNISSYNHLLDALAHSGQDGSGQRAEEILILLETQYGQVGQVAFNKVLKVWKNSAVDVALCRSEAILKRMVDLRIADHISYTSYIATLANHGTPESAQRANDIADQMLLAYKEGNVDVQPTIQTWNTVINAWVRSGNPQRAEFVLQWMEDIDESGMPPNVVSYSTVMDGWSKSNMKDSIERIERVLERMKATHSAGNMSARPNLWTYVTLIHTYAKHRDAIATQKAEDLVFQMYKEYKEGISDLKPNTKLVTVVLDAWQKSGALKGAEKAEALLDWMISVYEEENDQNLAPNEYSFSSVISAWGKSRSIGKSARARRVLNKMIDLHDSGRLDACPNTICYTAVINSCAYCENDDMDKRDALRIAIGTYKDLEKSSHSSPNHVTYSTLLTALRNLLPISPKRSLAIKDVFLSAITNGYVDQTVVQRVKSALSTDELKTLFPSINGDVRIDQLPNEWYRNVFSPCDASNGCTNTRRNSRAALR